MLSREYEKLWEFSLKFFTICIVNAAGHSCFFAFAPAIRANILTSAQDFFVFKQPINRVMQNHEARASDLNRKLIFSFFFAIFLIKATET